MPAADYEPVFSAAAWETFRVCSRRKRERLTRIAYLLAAQPLQIGDYQTADASGRSMENIRIEGFVLTFWPDHFAKELRIVDIVEL